MSAPVPIQHDPGYATANQWCVVSTGAPPSRSTSGHLSPNSSVGSDSTAASPLQCSREEPATPPTPAPAADGQWPGARSPNQLVAGSSTRTRSAGSSNELAAAPHPGPAAPPKRKTADGRTIVTTPWFPDGVTKRQLKLGDEIAALWRLMQLTPEETARRQAARAALHDAVTAVWREATVKCYGSFACGLSLPDSALDLVCEDCAELGRLDEVLDRLRSSGYAVESVVTSDYQTGGVQSFARLRCLSSGVACNASFVPGRSPARGGVRKIRELVDQFPAVAPLYAAVRLVARQSGCTADGGIPSYALLVMALHICHSSECPADAGLLLTEYVHLYGASSCSAGEPLWIEDPCVPGHNVLGGCAAARVAQLRGTLGNCAQALSKWRGRRWDGYRGRSPLSSVLAYGQLWARAEVKACRYQLSDGGGLRYSSNATVPLQHSPAAPPPPSPPMIEWTDAHAVPAAPQPASPEPLPGSGEEAA